jgi:hypothetical protein
MGYRVKELIELGSTHHMHATPTTRTFEDQGIIDYLEERRMPNWASHKELTRPLWNNIANHAPSSATASWKGPRRVTPALEGLGASQR